MKMCGKCGDLKPRSEFYPDRRPGRDLINICKLCGVQKQRDFRAKNGIRIRRRENECYASRKWAVFISRKYGITAEQYREILKGQSGLCAICKTDKPGGGTSRMHVDHDHATGKVRGLLCTRCNQMLGYVSDNPETLERAATYLRNGGVCEPLAAEVIRAYMDVC